MAATAASAPSSVDGRSERSTSAPLSDSAAEAVSERAANSNAVQLGNRHESFSEDDGAASAGSSRAVSRCLDGSRALAARSGDHLFIHRLLQIVFHAPTWNEFQLQNECPGYQPADRLVVKRRERVLSHLRIRQRTLRIDGVDLPIGILDQLATPPEYRCRGYATQLIRLAEEKLAERGAVAALVHTRRTDFFARRGFACCGPPVCSAAPARSILARLALEEEKHAAVLLRKERQISVRTWRQMELDALMRLHDSWWQGCTGGYRRDLEKWRWLISRRAFDRILIAIDGPPNLNLTRPTRRLLGYAVVARGRILEWVCRDDPRQAAPALLARVCSDAIEHDEDPIRLHAPTDSPAHRWFGREVPSSRRPVPHSEYMIKWFRPLDVFWCFAARLTQRAQEAGLSLPIELGLVYGGEPYTLVVAQDAARLETGNSVRPSVALDPAQLASMSLGVCEPAVPASAATSGTSGRAALHAWRTLFPRLPLWLPCWEDACGRR